MTTEESILSSSMHPGESIVEPCVSDSHHVLLCCRCGHCQRLAPVWDKLADHFASNPSVHIIKVREQRLVV